MILFQISAGYQFIVADVRVRRLYVTEIPGTFAPQETNSSRGLAEKSTCFRNETKLTILDSASLVARQEYELIHSPNQHMVRLSLPLKSAKQDQADVATSKP